MNTGSASNCVFVANSGSNGAGTYRATAVDCVYSNNSVSAYGGGFMGNSQDSSLYAATNCVFYGNYAGSGGGGAAYAYAANCTFVSNSCKTTSSGGAVIYFRGGTNCLFLGNFGGTGGAASSGTYRNCRFINNVSSGNSGAGNAIAAYDCEFTGNRAGGWGGAVTLQTATLSGCVFSNNWAMGGAGAVSPANNYAPVITNCLFIGNSTASQGGAVGHAFTYFCTFESNFASNEGGAFLGNSNNNPASNCVFIANSATNNGAATGVKLFGCLVVSNCTFGAGNTIVGTGYYRNCTFIDNTTSNIAAIQGSAINCLFSGNKPYDLGNAYYTMHNCLYGTREGNNITFSYCSQTDNTKLNLGADPKAAYYAPRVSSPARDAGTDVGYSPVELDLAGLKRFNGPIDIGCYEFWSMRHPTTLLLR